MKLLLDTHILLHALAEPERLTRERSELIEDPANVVFVSAVSIAEIAIKVSIGKLSVEVDLISAVVAAGFRWLDFSAREALQLGGAAVPSSRSVRPHAGRAESGQRSDAGNRRLQARGLRLPHPVTASLRNRAYGQLDLIWRVTARSYDSSYNSRPCCGAKAWPRRWFWIDSRRARSSEPASASSISACTTRANSSWRQRPRASR